MSVIGIVDYGMGNVRSVAGAVERLGHDPLLTADAEQLGRCHKLILPGVGAFGDAMAELHARGLIDTLADLVLERGRPFLGICLGAQLIGTDSDEFGRHDGLGWLNTHVCRMNPSDPTLRVPHVGWDGLAQQSACPLFEGIPDDALFYYVHSYCITTDDDAVVAATCDYGGRFVAVLWRDNIYATQFHPEKSQRHGLNLLSNFLERI